MYALPWSAAGQSPDAHHGLESSQVYDLARTVLFLFHVFFLLSRIKIIRNLVLFYRDKGVQRV